MASWNKVTAGDILYDVRRQRTGMKTELAVWPVKVISMDPVNKTAVCSWNNNPARRVTKKQLEKYRVKKP